MQPRSLSRRRRAVVGAVAAVACVAGTSLFASLPANADTPTVIPNSVPSWATSANDVGPADASTDIEGEVYLPLRDLAGATALATAVSTPGNPQFRKPLTPTAWIAKYAPTKADADQVTAYLRSEGLTITGVPQSHEFVVFRGPVDVVNGVLGAALHSYNHDGKTVIGPSKAPTLPASIASKVSGVSVDQGRTFTKPDYILGGDPTRSSSSTQRKLQVVPTPSASVPKATCSTYDGEHTATFPAAYGTTTFKTTSCGYGPSQLRSAYGVSALGASTSLGAGQTVAVVDAYASPTIIHDTNSYSALYGEPQLTSATYQQLIPPTSLFTDQAACSEPSGWQTEQTLDVESIHAVAPAAKVLYSGATDCGAGIDIALSRVLDGGLANIVSNSYGYVGEQVPVSVLQGQVGQQLQAAGTGIGLYYSSGDNGDETINIGTAQPDYPGSSPWVTSVGGTSIGIGKDGKKTFETGWGGILDQVVTSNGRAVYSAPLPGDLYGGGAGGGVSTYFDMPAYQKGVVPANLAAAGKRVSPDLGAIADPYTGFRFGIRPIVNDSTLQAGQFITDFVGGTSLAAPVTSALMAITQQASGTRLGFANPALYATYKVAPSAFQDVVPTKSPIALAYTGPVSGNSYLVTLDHDSSLSTAVGYDDVTGLGAISFQGLTSTAQQQ